MLTHERRETTPNGESGRVRPLRFFRDERFTRLAAELRDSYKAATPFPHIIIDGFLPVNVCEKLLAEFPAPWQIEWKRFDSAKNKKLGSIEVDDLGDYIRDILYEFNSPAALNFLEVLTGIGGLVPDPHFEGGGLHQIERGGFLHVHADFNLHPKLRLDRRINLLLYLNKDWREEYGGELELWDRDMSRCVKKIPPIFNRCVIFNTTDWSYHGHPEMLKCPSHITRKSLAIYYYSHGRPVEELGHSHGTLFQVRPATTEHRKTWSWRTRTICAGILKGIGKMIGFPGKAIEGLGKSIEPPRF
jgi:hypothetical protein